MQLVSLINRLKGGICSSVSSSLLVVQRNSHILWAGSAFSVYILWNGTLDARLARHGL